MSENHCCAVPGASGDGRSRQGPDYFFRTTLAVIVLALGAHYLLPAPLPYAGAFADAVAVLIGTMWWGVAAGIVAVGLMQRVPKAYFNALLGRGDTAGGLFRAALAGLLLDLCSHGILMVGAKLYERGASLAQVVTFLIASPWNSLSLTLVLTALIGLPWTLVFVAGSALVAVATGYVFMILVRKGVLPGNPSGGGGPPDGFDLAADAKRRLAGFRPGPRFFADVVKDGFLEGRMVMRWLFFGTILAALIRAYVPDSTMVTYFGPTLAGLLLTLLATTVIEVCSEGSAPVGAELVTRAGAPGNAFAFLMAGVATDYTEIMVIRQFSKSWRAALFLPLVSVPQILLLGWLMNLYGA